MKAEKQQKEVASRTIRSKKENIGLWIADNRKEAIVQTKLINDIVQRCNMHATTSPDEESESDDVDWTPEKVFLGKVESIRSGEEPRTDLEDFSHSFDGSYTRLNFGSGMASVRRGRGGQPYVQSRLGDFGRARVSGDYDSIAKVLDQGTAEEIEDRGDTLLKAATGERADFTGWTDEERRAATHLLAITQVAEENPTRTEGSALLARGGFQAISDGVETFHSVFNRESGLYTPAHFGGTGEMRQVADGERDPDSLISGLTDGV